MVSVFRASPVSRLNPKPVSARPLQPSPSSDALRAIRQTYDGYRNDPMLAIAMYELTHPIGLPTFAERQRIE